MTNQTESYGRCATCVGAADGEDGDGAKQDPLGEAGIEVPANRMRVPAAPSVLAGRAKRRLDAAVTRFVYGR